MLKRFAITALAIMLGLTAINKVNAAPVEIKIASAAYEGMPYAEAFNDMVNYINEKSNGKYHATVYTQLKLGNTSTVVQGLQTGMIHFVHDSSSNLSAFTPALGVFDYPYIFSSMKQVEYLFSSDFSDRITEKLSSKVLTYLSIASNTMRNMLTSKPAATLDDFRKLKLRVTMSKVHSASLKSMGFSTTPMAASELYTGLQQGVVDGLDLDYPYAVSMRIYEVAPFVFESKHMLTPQLLLTGTKWWNTLSYEDKALFKEAAVIWAKKSFELLATDNERCKKICLEGGNTITVPSQEELDMWIKAASGTREMMKPQQLELYEMIQEELKRANLLH